MKKIALISIILFSSLVFSGCQTRSYSENIVNPELTKLEKSQTIYIALPENASRGRKIYQESAAETVRMLQGALSPYAADSVTGSVVESASEAIESGKNMGATYVFIPVIKNWEHRIAAYSGKATKAAFVINVYDLSKPDRKEPVIIKELRAKGRVVAVISQQLETIITPLFNQFAKELFAAEDVATEKGS